MSYPTPANEAQRNEALRAYRIMDTPPELGFSEVGDLAAQICGCPVAYVSFIENDRFWFKARYGLPDDFESCPREIAFCSVTICGADLVLAPDLSTDDRFRDFHFVVNEPHFRFYCAMPLITPEGFALGTICVMDFEPRELTFGQQECMRRLAQQLVGLLEHRRRLIELGDAHAALAAEQAKNRELLQRVLPAEIVRELQEHDRVEPRFFPASTVLLADVQGFTAFTGRTEPATLIALLDRYFAAFDEAVAARGLEKIKTIGDAYLAVAGVPNPQRKHALAACLAALDMRSAIERIRTERERLRLPILDFRIGLHTGPIIAGVVGRHRFTYDVWGDAVNVASIMEAQCDAGRINVSEALVPHVDSWCEFGDRRERTLKGKLYGMRHLERLRPDYAADTAGGRPNGALLSVLAESTSTRADAPR